MAKKEVKVIEPEEICDTGSEEKDVFQEQFDLECAQECHEKIMQDIQLVNISFGNLCRDLKEMRDFHYYKPLGFDSFGAYTEGMHGIGERQAYKYIRIYEKLGAEFLNSSSKMGVSKLNALAALDAEERRELLEGHSVDELADMPVSEVKELTEKCKRLEEQLSMFESAKPELSDEERAALESAMHDELETKYVEKIEDLERAVIIAKGEKAKAEDENAKRIERIDELSKKIQSLEYEVRTGKFDSVDVLKKYVDCVDKLFSWIKYDNHFWYLDDAKKKVVVDELYKRVDTYFGAWRSGDEK